MTKRLFFLLGVLAGMMFVLVAQRKRMERLAWFEAAQADVAAFTKQAEAELRAHYASLPTAQKINLAMRRAQLADTDPEAYAAWKAFEAGGFDDAQ